MALKSFVQMLFGYDVFISHRWSKGAIDYAENLKAELEKRGLDCFVDGTNLKKGELIPNSIRRAIRKSTVFVLICSDDVLESSWIPTELAMAGEAGRQIVPINISDSLDRFPLRKQPWLFLKDRSRVEENIDALRASQPSPNVAVDIDQAFTARRQRVRAIRLFLMIALVFFGISLAAIGSAGYALRTRNRLRVESARLMKEIEDAKIEAGKARHERAVAEAEKAVALTEKQTAINEKLAAQGETKDAVKEKETAERATERAKTELFNTKADQLAVEAATMGQQIETRPQGVLTALDSLNMRWSAGAQRTVFNLLDTLRTPARIIDDRLKSPRAKGVISPSGRYAILLTPGPSQMLKVYDAWEGKKIADVNGIGIPSVNFINEKFFVGIKTTNAGDTLTVWKVDSGEVAWSEPQSQKTAILKVDTVAGEVIIDTGEELEIRAIADDAENPRLDVGTSLPHKLPIVQVVHSSEAGWTATAECQDTPGLIKPCQVHVWHYKEEVAAKSFDEIPLISFVPPRIAGAETDLPILATVAQGMMEFWTGRAFETSLQRIGVGQISELLFSPKILPKGERFFVTANDQTISFWKFDSYNHAHIFKQTIHPAHPLSGTPLGPLMFSPDGELLASALGNAVVVWDVSQPFDSVDSVLVHDGTVNDLAFVAEPGALRNHIVTTSEDGAIIVWASKEEEPEQPDSTNAMPVAQIDKLARAYVTRGYSNYLLH